MRPTATRTLAALTLTVVALAFADLSAAVGRPPAGQNPLAGSRVFGEKGCARCHAINGRGGRVGPDLARTARPRSLYDLGAAMWNHLPAMLERMRDLDVARPRLDADEVGDLVAFLFTVDYFDPPGDPRAGERLFRDKGCVLCHQVRGVGGVLGPNLDAVASVGSPIVVATAMWNHGPAMAEAMRARRIARPAFTDRQLVDLLAFLESAAPALPEAAVQAVPGEAEAGRRLFAEKRCLECHGFPGRGGGVGPDLADRARGRSLTQFATAMWNKQPAMLAAMEARGMSPARLTGDEMADVVAYLYAARYFGSPGEPGRGRALLVTKGCVACHAVRQAGGAGARDLAGVTLGSPQAVFAALWNHGFAMREGADRRGLTWAPLRPADMADLVAFFGTPAGRR